MSELGSAGVAFDIDRVEVAYGGTVVCRAGVAADHDDRGRAAHMAGADVEIRCDLGLGTGDAPPCSPPTSATATSTRTGRRRDDP